MAAELKLNPVLDSLKARGVKFEKYDMPGLKTKDGIAEGGGAKTAWFKDTEGNILALAQTVTAAATR